MATIVLNQRQCRSKMGEVFRLMTYMLQYRNNLEI